MAHRRVTRLLGVSSLLVAPSMAQFGLGNRKKKQGTNFQDLQERAAVAQGGGGGAAAGGGGGGGGVDEMDALRSMLGGALNDPAMQAQMEQMASQFGSAFEQMAKMSPQELQQQMQEAFKLMNDATILDSVVEHRDEVLKTLADTGAVPADELEKFRKDPEYFEQKLRESFDQIKDIMSNEDMMQAMSQGLSSLKDMGNDLQKLIGDLEDDDKIEEARLELLKSGKDDNPLLKEMMKADEMQELLQDPKKWRDSVKQGLGKQPQFGQRAAAGMGEL